VWSAVSDDARPVRFFSAFVGQEDRLHREVFFLAYHLHWSHPDVMRLATDERWTYVRLLSDQLEREHDAVEGAGNE
jgi:hypothetical protein